MGGIQFHPATASTIAGEVNYLFYTLVGFAGLLVTFLTLQVVYYAVRYRHGSAADRSGARARNLHLELAWTGASLVIAFCLFAWGAALFMERETVPPDAMQVTGLGKQWMWRFEHAGGQREINELHVPVGRPVLVTLGSEDVIHSLFIPAFRVKQDAVPGMSTRLWFQATEPGRFHLFCAEYCGTEHSAMGGWLVAMQPEDFAAWLDAHEGDLSIVQRGEGLFRSLGCSGCHGNSTTVRAPDLHGVFGRPIALSNGTTITADERYLRDSILQPNREVAAGYAPVMPSFQELIDEGELQQLIAYLKSLSAGDDPS